MDCKLDVCSSDKVSIKTDTRYKEMYGHIMGEMSDLRVWVTILKRCHYMYIVHMHVQIESCS